MTESQEEHANHDLNRDDVEPADADTENLGPLSDGDANKALQDDFGDESPPEPAESGGDG